MNSVKESNGNDSRTWYQDKKIRIRNTRIPDSVLSYFKLYCIDSVLYLRCN